MMLMDDDVSVLSKYVSSHVFDLYLRSGFSFVQFKFKDFNIPADEAKALRV